MKKTKSIATLLIVMMLVLTAATGITAITGPAYAAAGGTARIKLGSMEGFDSTEKFEFKLYKVGKYSGPRIVVDDSLGGVDVNIPKDDPERAEKLMAMAATVAEKVTDDLQVGDTLHASPGETMTISLTENALYLLVGNTVRSNGYNWTPQPVFIDILNGDKDFDLSGELKIVKEPVIEDHSVVKAWDPAYDQIDENFRLPYINVKIKYNGNVVDTVRLDPDNDWSFAWKSTEVPGTEDGKVNVTYIKEGAADKVFENIDPGDWTTEEDLSDLDPMIAARYVITYIGNKITNTYTTISLQLTKKLDGFVDTGEGGNVTMAFKIVGTKGESQTVVYTNYVGLTFNKNGEYSQTVTIDNIPKTADHFTITELYSGNYTSPAKKGVEAEYYPDEDIWKVTIDNTHDDHGPGSGVVNVFRDNEFDHNEGLVDRPQ